VIDSALILLLSVLTAGQVQPSSPVAPLRDAVSRDGAAKARTATVRGRVTDRETGQPLGRVMVTLMSTVWRDQAMSSSAMIAQTGIDDDSSLRQNQPRNTVTAADGRFEFKQVQPGA
jgi:protocatechuate 3,4-dioxygenase beta subunit